MARRAASPLAVIFVTVFLDLLGFGLTIPLLPFYAQHFGAGSFRVAALNAAYSMMQFAFVPVWGALSDRVGRRPVLLTSILATAGTMSLLGLAGSYNALLAARLLQGIATANLATAQAYIADVTTPQDRARGMGLIGAAFGLGFVLGPFAGGLLASVDLRLPGFAAAGLALANFLFALRNLPESLVVRRDAVERFSPRTALRAFSAQLTLAPLRAAVRVPGVARLIAVYFLSILAFVNLESTFALFTCDRLDFAARETGYLFGYMGLVVAIVQGGMLGRLSKRFGPSRLARAGFALMALALVALALMPRASGLAAFTAGSARCVGARIPAAVFFARSAWLWAPLLALAAGNGLANPSVSTLTSRRAPAERQGATLGAQQAMGSLARGLGPLAGGWAFDAVGAAVPYWLAAVGMAAALGAMLRTRDIDTGETTAHRGGDSV